MVYYQMLFALLCIAVAQTNAQAYSGNLRYSRELQDVTDDSLKKISSLFYPLLNQQQALNASNVMSSQSTTIMSMLGVTNDGSVPVDITASNAPQDLVKDLTASGCEVVASSAPVVTASCPVSSLIQVAKLSTVNFVHPVLASTNRWSGETVGVEASMKRVLVGSVTSEGVKAMRADVVQAKYGLDGKGVKIGVMSDSYNNKMGAPTDITSGDLPKKGVTVVKDLKAGGTDEGRAMLQIIYDIAPQAELYFYTAFDGKGDFACGIKELAKKGCKVIVDDIIYNNEPMFQDGIVAKAVDEVYESGVAYFSAANNYARQSWSGPFVDSGPLNSFNGYKVHNFNPSHPKSPPDPYVKTLIPISLTKRDKPTQIVLNWDQPFKSACKDSGCKTCQSNLDIYIYDTENGPSSSPLDCTNPSSGCSGGTDYNIGSDAYEILTVDVAAILQQHGRPDDISKSFQLQIVHKSGPLPSLMQIVIAVNSGDGDFTDELKTNSGTSYGHAKAKGAAGVAAALSIATPAYGVKKIELESYSSMGGIPNLFDTKGNRLSKQEIRKQPLFTGPSGVSTTFFDGEPPTGFKYPMFSGTSASAPHVAAVAALMLQAKSGLCPDDIYKALQKTAIDMSNPTLWTGDGYDYGSGYGFVDALAAVDYVRGGKSRESS